jgi:hypothetical protein
MLLQYQFIVDWKQHRRESKKKAIKKKLDRVEGTYPLT